MTYLLIALGGALGSVARYGFSVAITSRLGPAFPWGTLVVNVAGSFLIGMAFGAIEPGSRWQVSQATRDFVNQFFMIGILGGFTTFSSFSLQTLALMREGQYAAAGANVFVSVAACLLAAALGLWIATR